MVTCEERTAATKSTNATDHNNGDWFAEIEARQDVTELLDAVAIDATTVRLDSMIVKPKLTPAQIHESSCCTPEHRIEKCRRGPEEINTYKIVTPKAPKSSRRLWSSGGLNRKLQFYGNMEESEILELLQEAKEAPQYTILTFDKVSFDVTITAAVVNLLQKRS